MVKLNVPKVSINKNLLVKVAVAVVALFVVAALVTAVSSSWHEKQKQNKAQAQAAAAKQVAANKATTDKLHEGEVYKNGYNRIYVECQKGAAIYANVLTPAQKAQVQKLKGVPSCEPAVLPL